MGKCYGDMEKRQKQKKIVYECMIIGPNIDIFNISMMTILPVIKP